MALAAMAPLEISVCRLDLTNNALLPACTSSIYPKINLSNVTKRAIASQWVSRNPLTLVNYIPTQQFKLSQEGYFNEAVFRHTLSVQHPF